MFNETVINKLAKVYATSATDTSFPSKIPTLTKPASAGVITLGSIDGGAGRNNVLLIPYGTGSDNDTFDMRVIGWRPTPGIASAAQVLWIPTVLVQFACTMCAAVGVAASDVLNTERFVDTITGTLGNANVDYTIVSPANDTIAHVIVDAKGCPLVEVTFDRGASNADCNALHAEL